MARKSFRALAEIEPVYEDLRKQHPLLMLHGIAELIATQVKYPLSTIRAIVKDIEEKKRIGPGDTSPTKNTVKAPNFNSFFNAEPDVPMSLAIDRTPYRLPVKESKGLLLYDLHMPFHSRESIKGAVDFGVDYGVDWVIIVGDGIDFYSISRYEKLKKYRNLQQEINICRDFEAYLRYKFPKARILWKKGNHEYRLDRYLMQPKAQDLEDLECLQFNKLLHLADFDIEMVETFTLIKAGELTILHGHEIPGGGENVARNKLKRAMSNIVFGHSHLIQEDIQKTINDKFIGSWSIGCLCHMSPDYNPYNKWLNGFGIVDLYSDGLFKVTPKKFINGKIL
jgi:predicted phosphodiesterase